MNYEISAVERKRRAVFYLQFDSVLCLAIRARVGGGASSRVTRARRYVRLRGVELRRNYVSDQLRGIWTVTVHGYWINGIVLCVIVVFVYTSTV